MSNYSIYPNSIDGYAQLPVAVDGVTEINAFSVNTLRSAIYNIEVELGTLPSGDSLTVAARLDALQASIDAINNVLESITFADLGSATLAELNSIITDATLDDSSEPRTPLSHATSHESGGSDSITGDNLVVEFSPTNYYIDNEVLSDHLTGIDNRLGVTNEELEIAASKFLSKLDLIIFHLSLITGVDLPEREDPLAKLDDIILLFSLITEG